MAVYSNARAVKRFGGIRPGEIDTIPKARSFGEVLAVDLDVTIRREPQRRIAAEEMARTRMSR